MLKRVLKTALHSCSYLKLLFARSSEFFQYFMKKLEKNKSRNLNVGKKMIIRIQFMCFSFLIYFPIFPKIILFCKIYTPALQRSFFKVVIRQLYVCLKIKIVWIRQLPEATYICRLLSGLNKGGRREYRNTAEIHSLVHKRYIFPQNSFIHLNINIY